MSSVKVVHLDVYFLVVKRCQAAGSYLERQSKIKRLFSKKPKERTMPEVNVLPTPVLVPPEEAPEIIGPQGPPPVPGEVPAAEVAPPPLQEPPTGGTTQQAMPGTTRVTTAQRMPPQPQPAASHAAITATPPIPPALGATSGTQPAVVMPEAGQAGVPSGDVMRPAGSTPLDISRMGGPQHAEREAAALRDAAERATAPRPTPVTFQDEAPEEPTDPQMQSRALPSQETHVRGAAGYPAPVSHPRLGPGVAKAPVQRRPEFEDKKAEEEVLQDQKLDANAVDPPRGRSRERIIIHPPAQHEGLPARAGPADVSRYEEEEEAEEGGHDVEVQEEGYHPDEEQQPEAEIAWAPAEPAGRDASPTRLELRAQGVPGYSNQESHKTERDGWVDDKAPAAQEPTELTSARRAASRLERRQQGVPGYVPQESLRTAREEWPGEEASATEEPGEHTPAIEEPNQAPPHAVPVSTAEAPQGLPQEKGADPEPPLQGLGERHDVNVPEQEEANAGGADTRGQAIQTAYPEQPRTPATSMADASAQRPSEWAPEAGVGDQGHVVAVPAVPAEPKAAPEGERAPISRGQSVWAHPAAVQPVLERKSSFESRHLAAFEDRLYDRLLQEGTERARKEQTLGSRQHAGKFLEELSQAVRHGVMEERRRLRQQIEEQGLDVTMEQTRDKSIGKMTAVDQEAAQAAVKDPWTESLAEVASPDFSQSVSRPPIAGDKAKAAAKEAWTISLA
ncbi:g7229 [Coccomyxa viridis]|uniref:G7229 protein n=1 Tax=Coccomyxa viridis TaxID=1274662 RepID=A0ABP1FXB8_9CHLO